MLLCRSLVLPELLLTGEILRIMFGGECSLGYLTDPGGENGRVSVGDVGLVYDDVGGACAVAERIVWVMLGTRGTVTSRARAP